MDEWKGGWVDECMSGRKDEIVEWVTNLERRSELRDMSKIFDREESSVCAAAVPAATSPDTVPPFRTPGGVSKPNSLNTEWADATAEGAMRPELIPVPLEVAAAVEPDEAAPKLGELGRRSEKAHK